MGCPSWEWENGDPTLVLFSEHLSVNLPQLVCAQGQQGKHKLTLKSFYCHHFQAESLLYIMKLFKAFDMVCCSSLGPGVTRVFLKDGSKKCLFFTMRVVKHWGRAWTGSSPTMLGAALNPPAPSPGTDTVTIQHWLVLLWGRCWPSGPLTS